MITAIIDENVKAVDGSRVRLRLLDDVEIGDVTVRKGTYLYAIMSGFGKQRVNGKVESVFYNEEIIKVSLSIFDTDGLEGLYVPISQFRETAQDVVSSAMQGSNIIDNSSTRSGGIKTGLIQPFKCLTESNECFRVSRQEESCTFEVWYKGLSC